MSGRGLCLAIAAAALLSGCGYAFTAGKARMPPGAERVYVAPLSNRTGDAEAGAVLTGALREELARRGSAGGADAPARMEGVVLHSVFGPSTPDASTYHLALEVQVKLLVKGQPAGELTLRRQQDYLGEVDALGSEARRRVALRQAATDLARDIVERFASP
jgi:outer membrane lipopolysaccharide assembly protein LptE/RlpB